MADKTIGQLQAASQVTPTDLFVLEQSGTAKKLTGQILENWLLTFADGHGGIQSIEKTGTSGLTDTYTITLSDATTVTLTVHNGKGISSVTTYYAVSSSGSTVPSNWSTTRQSMTATNRYLWSYQRIAFNDNTNTDTAKTVIGVYGDKGDKGDTGNTGNGIASLAQTGRIAGEYTTYTFTMTDGSTESFEAYDGTGITNIFAYYAVSPSGSVIPSDWNQQPPPMTANNRYLWGYQDIRLSNGTGVMTPKIVIGVYGDKGDKGDPGEVTQAEFDELKSTVNTKAPAIYKTASGAIAHFEDGADSMPLKELSINIEAVQTGTGDPSPDNVRPITGWSGCNIVVSPTTNAQDGNTYAVTFPSPDPSTVYGGTLDLVKGKLTVNKIAYIATGTGSSATGGMRFYKSSNTARNEFYTLASNNDIVVPSQTRTEQVICSHFKTAAPSNSAMSCFVGSSQFRVVFPLGGDIETASQMNTWVANQYNNGTPLTYVLTLKTPAVYDLADIPEITTLIGTNNIWADTGNVSLEYPVDTKLYIDDILNAIITCFQHTAWAGSDGSTYVDVLEGLIST